MAPTRSRDGEQFEAAVIGSLDPGGRLHGSEIADWLSTQAQDRGIDVHVASPLLLLVFEDGRCRSSAYPAAVLFTVEAVGVGMVESRLAVGVCRPFGWTEFHPLHRPIARQTPPADGRRIVTCQKTAPRENSIRVGAVGLESFHREWTGFRNEMRQEDSPLGESAFRVADDTVSCQTDWKSSRGGSFLRERRRCPPGSRPATLRGCSSRSPMTSDEIILIDGNSTDATLITARSNRPDVRGSAPGRRRQGGAQSICREPTLNQSARARCAG